MVCLIATFFVLLYSKFVRLAVNWRNIAMPFDEKLAFMVRRLKYAAICAEANVPPAEWSPLMLWAYTPRESRDDKVAAEGTRQLIEVWRTMSFQIGASFPTAILPHTFFKCPWVKI